MYRFEIALRPIIKKNNRPIFRNKKTGKPILGKSKKLKEYENAAQLTLQSQKNKMGLDTLTKRLRASFIFYYRGSCQADFDNLLGAACDALQNSGIIADDKLIKYATIEIRENSLTEEKTVITLEPLQKSTTVKRDKKVSWSEAKEIFRAIQAKSSE